MSPRRTLVLGLGNPILRDDAVGLRLVAAFQKELPPDPLASVEVDACCAGGLALAERAQGFDRMILVDAIRTEGGTPGHWHRFTARSLRPTLNLSNVHDVNFATAFELGRRSGMHLPPEAEIHIFAVEVQDPLTFDERMSDALETAFPRLAEDIGREVRKLLLEPTPDRRSRRRRSSGKGNEWRGS